MAYCIQQIVQTAIASLVGHKLRFPGWKNPTISIAPVAFSFGWVAYGFLNLIEAVGDMQLMPATNYRTLCINCANAFQHTPNLESALRSILAQGDSQLLWADAICIDQINLKERTEQVRRMKSIFAKASKVIVWLGSKVQFCAPDLFSFLDKVAELCLRPGKYLYGKKNATDDFQNLDNYLKNAEDACWKMLRELHHCELFKRIWVVQEFNLAVEGYLLAGDNRLRLFNFKMAMFWIRKRYPTEVERFQIPWENLDPFIYLRFLTGDTSRPPACITGKSSCQNVYFVLRCVGNSLSTDPRDKIFGLLGHSSMQYWDRRAIGYTQVPIDYERPHTELYFAVACRLMEESQLMFTLSLVEHDEGTWKQEIPQCPSWVPQLDQDRCNYILGNEYRDRYKKSWSRLSSYKILDRILVVEGYTLDTVMWRSQTMRSNGSHSHAPIIKEAWEHLQRNRACCKMS